MGFGCLDPAAGPPVSLKPGELGCALCLVCVSVLGFVLLNEGIRALVADARVESFLEISFLYCLFSGIRLATGLPFFW